MLKIGEFARIGQVTVRTLRHYEEVGLLHPAQVDRFTSYRYYTLDQLPRLHRILALRELGLPLEGIGRLLDERLSAEHIQGMLRLRQAELDSQMEAARAQWVRVQFRLNQLEQEGKMAEYDVVFKQVEPLRVAVARATIPTQEETSPTFERLFDLVTTHILRNGARFAGPGIALWYDSYQEPDPDVAAAMPFEGRLPENERVQVQELSGGQVACVVHHGSFDGLGQAYQAGFAGLEANNYRLAGPTREVYLQYEREGDPTQYVTELQFPVVPA